MVEADADSVVMPLLRLIEADNSSDAFVLACYAIRGCTPAARTSRPVFGIASAFWLRWRATAASGALDRAASALPAADG